MCWVGRAAGSPRERGNTLARDKRRRAPAQGFMLAPVSTLWQRTRSASRVSEGGSRPAASRSPREGAKRVARSARRTSHTRAGVRAPVSAVGAAACVCTRHLKRRAERIDGDLRLLSRELLCARHGQESASRICRPAHGSQAMDPPPHTHTPTHPHAHKHTEARPPRAG